jgi:hypothetical protein
MTSHKTHSYRVYFVEYFFSPEGHGGAVGDRDNYRRISSNPKATRGVCEELIDLLETITPYPITQDVFHEDTMLFDSVCGNNTILLRPLSGIIPVDTDYLLGFKFDILLVPQHENPEFTCNQYIHDEEGVATTFTEISTVEIVESPDSALLSCMDPLEPIKVAVLKYMREHPEKIKMWFLDNEWHGDWGSFCISNLEKPITFSLHENVWTVHLPELLSYELGVTRQDFFLAYCEIKNIVHSIFNMRLEELEVDVIPCTPWGSVRNTGNLWLQGLQDHGCSSLEGNTYWRPSRGLDVLVGELETAEHMSVWLMSHHIDRVVYTDHLNVDYSEQPVAYSFSAFSEGKLQLTWLLNAFDTKEAAMFLLELVHCSLDTIKFEYLNHPDNYWKPVNLSERWPTYFLPEFPMKTKPAFSLMGIVGLEPSPGKVNKKILPQYISEIPELLYSGPNYKSMPVIQGFITPPVFIRATPGESSFGAQVFDALDLIDRFVAQAINKGCSFDNIIPFSRYIEQECLKVANGPGHYIALSVVVLNLSKNDLDALAESSDALRSTDVGSEVFNTYSDLFPSFNFKKIMITPHVNN